MLKNLSPGVKISISRSISTAFEQYMNSIEWQEERADIEVFVMKWREYINESASWYEKVDDTLKNDPDFHAELADKINQMIHKILSEPPTEAQIAEIEELQGQVQTKEYVYSCRAEARYVIEQLQNELKKNSSAQQKPVKKK
ncbi:MAG: hypothetical protein ACI35P_03210 [Bacillus sp. (in: firmicutes)]